MGNLMPGIESRVEAGLGQLHDALVELEGKTWEAPAYQAVAGLEQFRSWLSNTIAAAWSGEPPPPAPPSVTPGPPLGAILDSMATMRVNTLTVTEVGDILFNESKGMRSGEAGAWQLEEGKLATVHAIMNGDERPGAKRPKTAPETVRTSEAGTPERLEDVRIAEEAYYDRMINRTDMAKGRIYYGNRFNKYMGPRQGETVYHRYGPFRIRSRPVYIVIYNAPH
ncbi:MAG: hypothetical protein ACYDA9_05230 [Terriglobia bacterium]